MGCHCRNRVACKVVVIPECYPQYVPHSIQYHGKGIKRDSSLVTTARKCIKLNNLKLQTVHSAGTEKLVIMLLCVQHWRISACSVPNSWSIDFNFITVSFIFYRLYHLYSVYLNFSSNCVPSTGLNLQNSDITVYYWILWAQLYSCFMRVVSHSSSFTVGSTLLKTWPHFLK